MKKHFAYLLEKTGINAFFRHLNKGETKILLYHAVVEKRAFLPSLDYADQCLTNEEFEKQMLFLSSHCNVISFDDFLNHRISRRKPNIIITFDDGFLNNFTVAYPILKRFNLKATFFITTSFISQETVPWFLKVEHNKKKSLRNLPYELFKDKLGTSATVRDEDILHNEKSYFRPMSWENITEFSKNPLICIGSHCKTHYLLNTLPPDLMKDEIQGSKEIIEEKLNKKVEYISYPHGMYNGDVISETKRSGYKAGVTTFHGFNNADTDRYQLRRNEIGNRGDLNILSSVISGSWDLFRRKKYG